MTLTTFPFSQLVLKISRGTGIITGSCSVRLGKAFFPETRIMKDANEWVPNASTNQLASSSVPSSPLKET